MATIKGYSVAKSQKGFGSAVNSSTVYSLSSQNQAANQALNDAYGRTDTAQMLEGKVPTLKIGNNPGGVNALTGVVNTGSTHDCLTNTNAVAGTARSDLANQTVIATTTTITSTDDEAAGLVLRVPVSSTGAIDRANVRAVIGGEDYTDGDLISVDGWVGSRFEVDVAP